METRNNIKDFLDNTSCPLVDRSNELRLFHYNTYPRCDMERHIRGVIVDGNNNVIMPCLPYTSDIVLSNTAHNYLDFLSVTANSKYFVSFEGTIIRMFYYNDKWHVSTTRRIDAYQSRWGGPESFGDLFEHSVENTLNCSFHEFVSKLETSKQYIFLMRSTHQTRLVSPVDDRANKVFVVGVCDGDTFSVCDVANIPAMPSIEKFDFETVMSYDISRQGVFVMYKPTETSSTYLYKLITPQYQFLSVLRGGCFDVEQRYLELRNTSLLPLLLQHFQESADRFYNVEYKITRFAHYLCERYNRRFHSNKYSRVPENLYGFFRGLDNYKKEDTPLEPADVHAYFRNTHPRLFGRMLSLFN
jgi:hypothetical protein